MGSDDDEEEEDAEEEEEDARADGAGRRDTAKAAGRKIVFGDTPGGDGAGDGPGSEGAEATGPGVKDLIAHYEAASRGTTASDGSPSRRPLRTATNIQKPARRGPSRKVAGAAPDSGGAVVPPVNRRSSRRA